MKQYKSGDYPHIHQGTGTLQIEAGFIAMLVLPVVLSWLGQGWHAFLLWGSAMAGMFAATGLRLIHAKFNPAEFLRACFLAWGAYLLSPVNASWTMVLMTAFLSIVLGLGFGRSRWAIPFNPWASVFILLTGLWQQDIPLSDMHIKEWFIHSTPLTFSGVSRGCLALAWLIAIFFRVLNPIHLLLFAAGCVPSIYLGFSSITQVLSPEVMLWAMLFVSDWPALPTQSRSRAISAFAAGLFGSFFSNDSMTGYFMAAIIVNAAASWLEEWMRPKQR